MRPDFGHIKDIPFVFLGLFGAHQLNVDIPHRIVTPLDSLKHVLDHVIRVLSGDLRSLLAAEILYPLLRFDVDFGVFERTILNITLAKVYQYLVVIAYRLCEFVRVSTVRIHVTNRFGCATVTE